MVKTWLQFSTSGQPVDLLLPPPFPCWPNIPFSSWLRFGPCTAFCVQKDAETGIRVISPSLHSFLWSRPGEVLSGAGTRHSEVLVKHLSPSLSKYLYLLKVLTLALFSQTFKATDFFQPFWFHSLPFSMLSWHLPRSHGENILGVCRSSTSNPLSHIMWLLDILLASLS